MICQFRNYINYDDETIFEIRDNVKDVINDISPLLLYFSETTSSEYSKKLRVKSNKDSNK